ncbi:MAG: 3'3'-cGAMP-specific phosphodiesterase 1 [Candidatus Dichloromethanomonas elyunquensis]|nr:MAG: 3'3'-cGAMP-specific phosphodiesterase 1 [Candidatus Dichloromethanomonas elyunquensis]
MSGITTAEQVIRRIWSFSKALDLALIDEEVRKGFKIEIGCGHGERVGYISMRLGHILGLKGSDLFFLMIAGLMHDIGAVGGFAEYHGNSRLMELHSGLGAKIMSDFPGGDILSEAITYHHKTPEDNLEIPVMAQIISLADKLDIMMERKIATYRDRARILNHVTHLAGKDFFPGVADALVQLAGEEAFWLYLNEGELLEPTLAFLCKRRVQEHFEFRKICDLMFGELFTQQLSDTFAFLIDQKSTFTGRHSRSVAENAYAMAMELGWGTEQCREIKLAGLLHDLGKLAVPQKILDKAGSLNEEEVQIIRTHTYYTHNLLSAAGFARNVVEWASYHHERLDGRGYPFRVPVTSLTTGCRIMTIADIFTALTEDRPYRNGLSEEKAMEIIRSGVHSTVDEELVSTAEKALL